MPKHNLSDEQLMYVFDSVASQMKPLLENGEGPNSCLLCSIPTVHQVGIFIPDEQPESLGRNKVKVGVYMLCEECFSLLDGEREELVEKELQNPNKQGYYLNLSKSETN